MTKKKLLEIEWDDAFHLTDSWSSLEDIAATYKQKRFRVTNIGWLLYEDRDFMILGSKHSADWHDWGGVIMIPRKVVIRKRYADFVKKL